MKRATLLAAILAIVLPISASAQPSAFGFLVGGGESLSDPLDFSFGDTVYQISYETELEAGTKFRIQYGTFDTETKVEGESDPLALDTNVEFVNVIGQYEFDEVYGQSSIFGGLGLYRQRVETLDSEKDWGLVLGVNGTFPVTRRFALTLELAYHWADFDQNLSALIAAGGFKVRF